MIKKVFTVYDAKAELYMEPFMFSNQGEAIRGFIDVCNDPKTVFYKHPEDYTLFYIADYDNSIGNYHALSAKVPLGTAIEYMKKGVEISGSSAV